MKKITLFLLIIWESINPIFPNYIEKDNKPKEDIVLIGKLVFKDKLSIRFYMTEKEGGNYKLILFQGNSDEILLEKSNIVKNIFKEKICSELNHSFLINDKGQKYFLINFSNKEIKTINGIKLISLGFKIINLIEKETNSNIKIESVKI